MKATLTLGALIVLAFPLAAQASYDEQPWRQEAGPTVLAPFSEGTDYGRLARLYDLEGSPLELWEPKQPELSQPGFPCLPNGVKPSDVVSAERRGGQPPQLVTVTVSDTLTRMRARCVKTKLLDLNGREVGFYLSGRLTPRGGWRAYWRSAHGAT